MGPGVVARALMRAAYRLVRFPIQLLDDLVLPVIFDEEAPVRRAYENVLLGCDGAAAYILADDRAAVPAAFPRGHSGAAWYAIARHPYRIHTESEVVMEHYRHAFENAGSDTHPHPVTRGPLGES